MKTSNQKKSLWTPSRVFATMVVLCLFAMFGASSCSSGDEKRNAPAPPPVAVNSPPNPVITVKPSQPTRPAVITLPASVTDAELKSISGGPIKLAKYSGKAMIVNLWATWCGPCRLEIPELVKFHQEYRAKGLEVIGLSTEDPEESDDKVRKFVHDFNVSYRIGWASPDVAISLMQGTDSIPQSFVIGRDGRVVRRFVGFNPNGGTTVQIRQAIEEALATKAAD